MDKLPLFLWKIFSCNSKNMTHWLYLVIKISTLKLSSSSFDPLTMMMMIRFLVFQSETCCFVYFCVFEKIFGNSLGSTRNIEEFYKFFSLTKSGLKKKEGREIFTQKHTERFNFRMWKGRSWANDTRWYEKITRRNTNWFMDRSLSIQRQGLYM